MKQRSVKKRNTTQKKYGRYVDEKTGKSRVFTDATKLAVWKKVKNEKGEVVSDYTLNKSAIEALAKKLGLSTAEVQNQVKALMAESAEAKKKKYGNQVTANVRTLISRLVNADNKVTRFLANMGVTPSELLEEIQLEGYDIDAAYLNDESHWTPVTNKDGKINSYKIDAPFYLPNGDELTFEWNYEEGSHWVINKFSQMTSEDVED